MQDYSNLEKRNSELSKELEKVQGVVKEIEELNRVKEGELKACQQEFVKFKESAHEKSQQLQSEVEQGKEQCLLNEKEVKAAKCEVQQVRKETDVLSKEHQDAIEALES